MYHLPAPQHTMSSSSSAIPITRKDVSAAADEDAFGFGTSGSPRTRAHQLLARSPAKAASSNAHSHSASSTSLNAVAYLKSLKAVRERATLALKTAMARGSGDHFDLDLAMLDDAASFVIELGFRDYAVGDKIDASKIPPHSRWRQFEAGGRDRIKDMMDSWGEFRSPHDMGSAISVIFGSETRSYLSLPSFRFHMIWMQDPRWTLWSGYVE